MNQRCNNTTNRGYAKYGGRGIKVDPAIEKFLDYAAYVTALPGYDPSATLDRIDNNGNYCKGNLRWTTNSVQTANQGTNSRGFNRYTGVGWSNAHNRWVARIHLNRKSLFSRTFLTEKDALKARNEYILANNLPHPMQVWSD